MRRRRGPGPNLAGGMQVVTAGAATGDARQAEYVNSIPSGGRADRCPETKIKLKIVAGAAANMQVECNSMAPIRADWMKCEVQSVSGWLH